MIASRCNITSIQTGNWLVRPQATSSRPGIGGTLLSLDRLEVGHGRPLHVVGAAVLRGMLDVAGEVDAVAAATDTMPVVRALQELFDVVLPTESTPKAVRELRQHKLARHIATAYGMHLGLSPTMLRQHGSVVVAFQQGAEA